MSTLCFLLMQDNSSVGDGTYFLQEYTMPRGSNSFSLYDTRSLSDDASDNINMIKLWIMEGVRHGELVIRYDFVTAESFFLLSGGLGCGGLKSTLFKLVQSCDVLFRRSDSSSLRNRMRCKARKIGCDPSVIRKVNFVIFVVDGLAVLKSMEGDSDVEKQYDQIVATTFNCPYLSFRGISLFIFIYLFIDGVLVKRWNNIAF